MVGKTENISSTPTIIHRRDRQNYVVTGFRVLVGGFTLREKLLLLIGRNIGVRVSLGVNKKKDIVDKIDFKWDIVRKIKHPPTGDVTSTSG